jgi:hypothetical protein
MKLHDTKCFLNMKGKKDIYFSSLLLLVRWPALRHGANLCFDIKNIKKINIILKIKNIIFK